METLTREEMVQEICRVTGVRYVTPAESEEGTKVRETEAKAKAAAEAAAKEKAEIDAKAKATNKAKAGKI